MAHSAHSVRRSSDLRRTNEIDVLDHLRRSGPHTRADLRELTTLSSQALADILQNLEKAGIVTSTEAGPPVGTQRRRGRPELSYAHNPARLSVVAVYVGLRYCEISACDAAGRPLTSNIELMPGWDPLAIRTAIVARVRHLADQQIIDLDRTVMAIVVHGQVDPDSRMITADDMGWHDVELCSQLEHELGCSVIVREASQAAAMAEYIEGAQRGCERLAVLNIGVIVSGTLIEHGIVNDGVGGLAGTIGRCWIPTPHGPRLVDDVMGHIAIKRSYEEKSGKVVRWARDVRELSVGGDPHAREVSDEVAHAISFAVSWLVAVTSPERFVVTGAVSDFSEEEVGRMLSTIESRLDARFAGRQLVSSSMLGRQAWLRGGIHAALDVDVRERAVT